MKKKDLKTGMKVRTREGELRKVMLNVRNSNEYVEAKIDILFSRGGYLCLRDFDDNLNCINYSEFDVMEIYIRKDTLAYRDKIKDISNYKLFWSREKPVIIDGEKYSKATIKRALRCYLQ